MVEIQAERGAVPDWDVPVEGGFAAGAFPGWLRRRASGYRWSMLADEPRSARERPKWRRGMFGTSARGVHAGEWQHRHWSSRLLHRVGEVVSHAASGIVAAALVAIWTAVGVISGFPDWWQTTLYSVTGCVTFVMVFVIQHTQQRQTAATQRKLDEMLRSSEQADSALIAVEEAPDEDLERRTRSDVSERERVVS